MLTRDACLSPSVLPLRHFHVAESSAPATGSLTGYGGLILYSTRPTFVSYTRALNGEVQPYNQELQARQALQIQIQVQIQT